MAPTSTAPAQAPSPVSDDSARTDPTAAPAPDAGFKLPKEAQEKSAVAKELAGSTSSIEVAPVPQTPVADTSTRDLSIGAGIFVVLLLVYFFVRNAYVHHLVVKRVAPSTAGSAGWLLFLGLAFVSSAAVLAIINASRFMSFAIGAPLVLVGVVSLVAAVVVGRR